MRHRLAICPQKSLPSGSDSSPRRRLRAAPLAALLALLFLQACFYDSRWGSARRAQQVVAAHATPAEIQATPAEPTEIPARRPIRTLRVRALATARHAAEVVDWPRQLADLLEDASRVLV